MKVLKAMKWLLHRQAKLELPGLKELGFADTKVLDECLGKMIEELSK